MGNAHYTCTVKGREKSRMRTTYQNTSMRFWFFRACAFRATKQPECPQYGFFWQCKRYITKQFLITLPFWNIVLYEIYMAVQGKWAFTSEIGASECWSFLNVNVNLYNIWKAGWGLGPSKNTTQRAKMHSKYAKKGFWLTFEFLIFFCKFTKDYTFVDTYIFYMQYFPFKLIRNIET